MGQLVDTNLHAHAMATAFGRWEAWNCTIRRSGFPREVHKDLLGVLLTVLKCETCVRSGGKAMGW